MIQKSKSWQIEMNRIDNLVQQIRSNPQSEVLECKSKHEVLRAMMDGKLVIVYSSGKVVYHDSPKILAMLSKYGKAVPKARKKKERKPINMKMNEEQKAAIIQAIALIAEPTETPGEYEEAAFTLDGAKITIYSTGSVYSPHGHPRFEAAIINIIKEYPIYPQYDIIIGQDEVGKGEIFGPMIVGSVAVTQDEAIALQFAGVKDSKELSATRIEELAESIKRKSIARRTIAIQAKRFNELFEKFKEEDKTLNDLLAWAHFKALEEVLLQLDKKGKQDAKMLVIIDEFSRVSTDKTLRKLQEARRFDLIQTPRAESLSASVAAASILAKAHRNSDMEDLKEIINLPLDRKNLQTIMKHPRAPDVVRYAYIGNGTGQLKTTKQKETGDATKKRRAQSESEEAILKLTEADESQELEFKSSLSWDYDKGNKNKKLEYVVAKTVAGFMNAYGGTLLIGVDDHGKILGLQKDYSIHKKNKGRDGFELRLREVLDNFIGVQFGLLFEVEFAEVETKEICAIRISRSTEPVYLQLKEGTTEFALRSGNRTKLLHPKQIEEYRKKRWKK